MSTKTEKKEALSKYDFEGKSTKKSWYAILTHPSSEQMFIHLLILKVNKLKLNDFFGKVLFITKTTETIGRSGKRKKVQKKMMPGYVFLHMEMSDDTYKCVLSIEKAVNFVGGTKGKTPLPLKDEEVERLFDKKVKSTENQEYEVDPFEKGEVLTIIEGPFKDFVGRVDEIDSKDMKLKLLVKVFGRDTPVEIDFNKVKRSEEQ